MRASNLLSMSVATAVLFVASGLTAQASPKKNEVIGITRPAGSTKAGIARQKTDFAKCAITECVTGLAGGAKAYSGGAAFNGDVAPNLTKSLGGLWVSNGRKIALLDPFDCKVKCAPKDAPLKSATAEVTGLAYIEDDAALLMSDSDNYLYWVKTSGCALAAVACDTWRKSVVPSGYTIGGLATDDTRRLLFVSASTFGTTPVRNKIWVGILGAATNPMPKSWCALATGCELNVPACGSTTLGAITGLGFDACTSTLYLTDGTRTMGAKFTWDLPNKTCRLTSLGCCSRGTAAPLGGLCVVQKRAILVGKSCVGKPCIDCPSMLASTYGDAFLGNRNFALSLSNAPTGSTPAFLALAPGACVTPGVNIGFCDTVKINLAVPPLLIAMPVRAVGSGPCDGTSLLSFGVPRNVAFCGLPISAQWAMECQGPNGKGKAISNCVTFEITTN